ncbi:hypothetical protein AURDEDRAFT_151977 [Auricularia subglabra TFB-10046 SS5]|nr:hypothetical protein AURDEDRAFT_151977 [Auricularia subglabra TFB-10046 SS5]
MSTTPATLQQGLALLNEYNTSTELGILLSSTLFGVFCVQTLSGYEHCAVEAVHTALLWYSFISTGNRSRLNPLNILAMTPELAFVYFTSGVLGTTVQAYYASRLYLLSGSILLALFAWVGSAARLGLTVVGAVVSFRSSSIMDYMLRYGWCMKAVFGASVAVDVWNTVAICCIFARRRSGQQYAMALVIDKLTMWAVETGLITRHVAVASCFFGRVGVTDERSSILAGLMLIFTLVGNYIFSLSLLLTLNGRDGMWKTLLRSRNSVSVALPVHVEKRRSFWVCPERAQSLAADSQESLTHAVVKAPRDTAPPREKDLRASEKSKAHTGQDDPLSSIQLAV